jgi:Family of unknown function (DUF6345)
MKSIPLKSLWILTAAGALCGGGRPVLGQTTNLALPVYRVLQSGATAVQARTLADALRVPFNQLSISNGQLAYLDASNFMAVPTAPVTDPKVVSELLAGTENPYPDIPIRFQQIDFGALGRLTVPSGDLALRTASDAFGQTGLTPQYGSPVVDHTLFHAYYSNDNHVVVSNSAFLDTRVAYQFSLPGGYPLIGPGAQVDLTFGPGGNVTRLQYAARQLEPGPSVEILPSSEAVRRVARLFPANARIDAQLVYWCPPFWWHWPWPCPCPPPRWQISTILPWYQCTATTAVTDPKTGAVSPLENLTQMVPATDDPAFVPAVNLSVSVVGGNAVTATATVSGGIEPYSFEWSGSPPDVASNTGPMITYTPMAPATPPELSVRFIASGLVRVSWAAGSEPTSWFLLESTPSLNPVSWIQVPNPVQTSNGVNSVDFALNGSPARFFRLRLADPPLVATETVAVVVTDANGVQVQASREVQVPVTPVQKSPTAARSPRIVGVIDWGTESPFDPGLGTGDRTSWTTGMILGGAGAQRFLWIDTLAWKKDFIEEPAGIDDYEVDNADIVLYIGHGNPVVFTFTGGPGPSPTTLFYNDAPRAWGDLDQEWLCLLSCDVLEFDDPNGNVWQRWGPNFDGLHILTGFHSLAGAGTGFPGTFAMNMLGLFGFLTPPMPIVNAWFAAAHARGTGSPAAMGPIGPGGAWDFGDYYWGKGPVGPTIRASQIHGWWYAQ